MVRGLTHRLARQKPAVRERIDVKVVDEIIDHFFPVRELRIPDFGEWLAQTTYTESRKKRLQQIYDGLQTGEMQLSRMCKFFIKAEFYDTMKNPRIISSRDDTFKVLVGPYFKALEDYVFSHKQFIKHVPVTARAKYVTELFAGRDYDFIVNDHTSFETHAHSTFRQFEFRFYKRFNEHNVHAHLKTLMGTQTLKNPYIVAQVQSRMSGEMNTSLGNGLSNFLSFAYIMRTHGASFDDIVCIVEGDDAIFAIPKHAHHPTKEDFEKLGFDVVIEPKPSLGKCGFCSTYFTEDGKYAIVEPIKAVTKLPFTFNFTHNPEDLRYSKALSFCCEYRGVPMLQALGQRLRREHPRGTLRIDDWYERELMSGNYAYTPVKIHQGTRTLFAEMFGYTQEMQVAYERHVRTCPYSEIFNDGILVIPSEYYKFYQEHRDIDWSPELFY